jgi:metallo-beta-lactamase family protein
VKDGFSGRIISTHATRSQSTIMLLDSAHIQERDVEYYNTRERKKRKGSKKEKLREALYDSHNVAEAMGLFVTYGYDQWVRIHDKVRVIFRDAGHILGSASVTLEIEENGKTRTFGFTGDIGRPNRPILRDPRQMPPVDFLICESTYGDKLHEGQPAETKHFLSVIKNTCVERGGKVIIPAFSVGRTQEIVYLLDRLASGGDLPKIPVFVDSPLAVNATQIYGSHPECYDDELHEYLLMDDNPFGFNDLHYVRSVEGSKALNEMKEPCIIISSAGMMNFGRIRHHLYNHIENPNNTILVVGYCTPDTTGGHIRSGANAVRIFGEWKMVNARVEIMDSFSAHGDQHEMRDFIQNQKTGNPEVFLVHGEYDTQQVFRDFLEGEGFRKVQIPEMGQILDL